MELNRGGTLRSFVGDVRTGRYRLNYLDRGIAIERIESSDPKTPGELRNNSTQLGVFNHHIVKIVYLIDSFVLSLHVRQWSIHGQIIYELIYLWIIIASRVGVWIIMSVLNWMGRHLNVEVWIHTLILPVATHIER